MIVTTEEEELFFPLPSVNFTNVLQAAFTLADTKSTKKTVKSSSFFALSGSASVKAAHRTLVKLTPTYKGAKNIVEKEKTKKSFNKKPESLASNELLWKAEVEA